MAAELLLVNPRKRRAKKSARRPATARRRRNPVKIFRKAPTVAARASNPRRRRRRNPVTISRRFSARRRRNPINIGGVSMGSFMGMLKDAAVGGAGAIGMDMLWARVNGYLPAQIQSIPGVLNVGTAVKAFATAVVGQLLAKPTRGLSRKAASGALAVQARDAIACVLPQSMALGYASPAAITQGTMRVGPIRRGVNGAPLGRYMRPGQSPLLNGARMGAYIQPGATPLLNGAPSLRGVQSARMREAVVR